MTEERVQDFVRGYERLKSEVHKVIVGHEEIVDQVLVCLFAGGHVLLEGVPGLGKTLLVRTLASCVDLTFSRIQFTPDLMPADIIGTNIIVEDAEGRRHFQFQRGPIFAHVLLADEVNRATPKTQSALLEGMQEGSVTVSGVSHRLPSPFFVLATQNPIEMEGTYPLPEAQLDRFLFKLRVRYPAIEELNQIIERTTRVQEPVTEQVMTGDEVMAFRELVREVPIASHVRNFASLAVMGTHTQWEGAPDVSRRYLRYGASPRAAQALVLGGKVLALRSGRFNVSVEDLKAIALPAMRHRIILNFEGEAEGIDGDRLITEVLEAADAAIREGKEVFLR
ncbi:MAG TPA: AAA family ATPase [Methylomirabilota bacterium]|jgi:MoxR-like ATPase|nr:AAA family ATPase [Methylomirabilota bacterium]